VSRVNAFDWPREFPEAMAPTSASAGGFDAVIGNPPWGATFAEQELEYLRLRHRAIIIRMIDSYIYFVHAAFELLNRYGTLGMILPSTVLTQADAAGLRNYLLAHSQLRAIVNLGQGVFGRHVLNTSAIVIADSGDQQPKPGSSLFVGDLRDASTEEKRLGLLNLPTMPSQAWTGLVTGDSMCTFFTLRLPAVALLHRLRSRFAPFQDVLEGEIQRGVSPDLAEAFVVAHKIAQEERLEEAVLRPLVLGKDIARYGQLASDHYLIYLTRNDDVRKYPRVKEHLDAFKSKITCREVADGKHPWFSLHRPRNPNIFLAPKFVGLTTSRRICVAVDETIGYYATDALYLFSTKPSFSFNQRFVLAVLNSRHFQFLYETAAQGEQRVIPQVKAAKLYDLPFPVPDARNPADVARHDRMGSLVTQMLDLHARLAAEGVPHEKAALQRRIEMTDRQIDALVYELYELTPEEIKVVEGATVDAG
jgi:hypothetical protein